jgi:hypothetical protein
LPIEGVHTKWLASHATLVLALLNKELPNEVTSEADESNRTKLHHSLGLRVPPGLINVGVLDSELRDQVGGMRHFAASVEDLNRWPRTPTTVLLLENKETGYAITEDILGTVVLHGAGGNVTQFARIRWVREARKVIYWGDLDLPGLAFLSDLRGAGVAATSVLTDLATLEKFGHLAVEGASTTRLEVPYLSTAERELYGYLEKYANEHSSGRLLEQERIEWDYAWQVLRGYLEG